MCKPIIVSLIALTLSLPAVAAKKKAVAPPEKTEAEQISDSIEELTKLLQDSRLKPGKNAAMLEDFKEDLEISGEQL